MLSIEKSPVFQQEYANWKSKISLMPDIPLKIELSALLDSLLQQVKTLDQHHKDVGLNNRISGASVDTRSSVTDIRRKIDKKIKDFEESQLVYKEEKHES